MTRHSTFRASMLALLVLGLAACQGDETNNYYEIQEEPPPVVEDCTTQVYSVQPTIVARTELSGTASGTVTLNAVVAGNEFSLGGVEFTAVAADATAEQFLVGADDAATAANLAAAIAAHETTAALVTAAAAGNVITFTALAPGFAGNTIFMSGTSQRFTTSGTSLLGGRGTGKSVITADGLQFKDLSGDGGLDPYEDWRLSEICRAKDLASKMTVPQKVALMSESSSIGGGTADGSLPSSAVSRIDGGVRQALIRFGARTPQELAVYLNNVQELCELRPLGIPFIITADPVHGIGMSTNATSGANSLSATAAVSHWPYPMGLGAINDTAITKQYGDTVRQEFMAMGFRWQLGPMADLATEPRWARVQNVFGENALHVAKHVKACVEGYQGSSDGRLREGIAATVKHFPGAGADEDGMDSHRYPGRYNVYPGDNFEYNLVPFQVAFDVGAAAIMPCYSIFKEQYEWDPFQVPSGFSHGIITKLGKERMGFTGMVTGDWGTAGGSAYNLEGLTGAERAILWLKAGSHQYGSDSSSNFQAAYDQGLATEADIDGAAIKILEMTFKVGAFENPYVDPDAAATIVKSPENRMNGFNAQKRAIVLLQNTGTSSTRPLPISGDRAGAVDTNGDGVVRVYFDGVTDALNGSDLLDDVLEAYDYRSAAAGTTLAVEHAATLAEADVAVLRIVARKGTYFGLDAGVPLSFDKPFPGTQNDGGYAAAVKDRNKVIDAFRVREGYTDANGDPVAATNPTLKIVLVMHMDRPGIVKPFLNGLKTLDETPGEAGSYPLVSDQANVNQTVVTTSTAEAKKGVEALLVDFGAYDRAVLDFVFDLDRPPVVDRHGTARLPVEIPSSDEAVEAQFEDVPHDSLNPTYRFGAGSNL